MHPGCSVPQSVWYPIYLGERLPVYPWKETISLNNIVIQILIKLNIPPSLWVRGQGGWSQRKNYCFLARWLRVEWSDISSSNDQDTLAQLSERNKYTGGQLLLAGGQRMFSVNIYHSNTTFPYKSTVSTSSVTSPHTISTLSLILNKECYFCTIQYSKTSDTSWDMYKPILVVRLQIKPCCYKAPVYSIRNKSF